MSMKIAEGKNIIYIIEENFFSSVRKVRTALNYLKDL